MRKSNWVTTFTLVVILASPSFAGSSEGSRCHGKIRSHLKAKFRDAFFYESGLPKRRVSEVRCETKLSRKGSTYYDCEASTTAVLDERSEEVGGGDQAYTLRLSESCGVIFSVLSGEE
mgnify:CR=1 FL=1